jgi:hypothetical protein
MKSLTNLIKNEDLKKYLLNPMFNLLYNELYIYIWIICLYNIIVFCIILSILYILLRYTKPLMEKNLETQWDI